MKYSKTLVCLANSRKTSGRCVAGKELLDNGKVGNWIRPISKRKTHELSEQDRQYKNGQDVKILDIVQIYFIQPLPQPHQKENHIIDESYYWHQMESLSWSDVITLIDNPNSLWCNGFSSYSGINDRVPVGQEDGISLFLIKPSTINLIVGNKAPQFTSKRSVRCEFIYKHDSYCLSVTDPVVERAYLAKDDGLYSIDNCILCISLGDQCTGYYYKLVAAILYKERFS